jgi:hypothetical protein
MNDSTTIQLIRLLLNNEGISYELKRNVEKALNANSCAVWWSIDDLEDYANRDEEAQGAEVGSIYDRSLFRDVLHDMCNDSDPECGVTWYTVEHYLNEYCLIEE